MGLLIAILATFISAGICITLGITGWDMAIVALAFYALAVVAYLLGTANPKYPRIR